ncbi:helix-turn-helix domain-containing protein [Kitasatospora sp. NPDC001159]
MWAECRGPGRTAVRRYDPCTGGAEEEASDAAAAERAVAVLKAVADPSRYRLLWALSRRELPVGELAELLGAHVAATSQHLAKLPYRLRKHCPG